MMTNLMYIKSGDYAIPAVKITETSKPIGCYGRMRRTYLQEEKPILYNDLVLTEKLFSHLLEVDEIAQKRFDYLMEQMKVRRNINETLKQRDPISWVGDGDSQGSVVWDKIFKNRLIRKYMMWIVQPWTKVQGCSFALHI